MVPVENICKSIKNNSEILSFTAAVKYFVGAASTYE